MKTTDFEAFRECIENVHEFYGKPCSSFTLDVWWLAMKHHDLAAVQDAVGRHLMNPDTGQFMPKPADVVRMLEGSTIDSAVVAWTKVERALQQVGTYATVVFDDPIIHRVVADMGGWITLGAVTVDELPFKAREFQTRYRGFRARSDVPAYPPKLTGLVDHENGKAGYTERTTPIMIGNAKAAQRVFLGGSDKPLLEISALTPALMAPREGAAA